MPHRSLVPRARLLEVLGQRWERRVVEVVAGPGFGKTVLVTQAVAENRLAPRGTDLVLRCGPADGDPGPFLRQAADAVGLAQAKEPTVGRLLAELARRWPLGVSLVIDDAHHLAASGPGRALLADLADLAPEPVHLVLVSRRRLPGLARLRGQGEVIGLSERDLALTASEVAELVRRGPGPEVDPAALAGLAGWPAAVALAASSGIVGALDYVTETVLGRLAPAQRRLLAVAACLGTAEPDLVRVAAEAPDADPAALADTVPLVERNHQGELVVHELWRPLAVARLEAGERRQAVGRAAICLTERGHFDRAFRLCAGDGDWEPAGAVLEACCGRGHVEVPLPVLEAWLALWPADRREEPHGLLLRGLVARARDPFGPATVPLLDRALQAQRDVGNQAGQLAAGVALVHVLRNQGHLERLPPLLAEAVELHQAGWAGAAGPATVARALLAECLGDEQGMIDELDRLEPGAVGADWEMVIAYRRAVAYLVLGQDQAALAAAGRVAGLAGDQPSRHVLTLVRWLAGDPRGALDPLDGQLDDPCWTGADRVVYATLGISALACAGRVEDASAQLGQLEATVRQPGGPLMEGAFIGARAFVLAAAADDDGAAALLAEALGRHPVDSPAGRRLSLRWQPLAYVLLPEVRATLDCGEPGPLHRRRLDAARLVVWARDGAARVPEAAARWAEGGGGSGDHGGPVELAATLATSVPLPWAVLVGVRLAAADPAAGATVTAELIRMFALPARDELRRLAASADRRTATAARSLLASLTLAPTHDVRLEALGPTVLRLNGAEQHGADWSRARVRSLLLHLVLRGSTSREQIADALWPDLDPEAAARNLRVTLSYLNRVLEPDRRTGEAPHHIRQSGPVLSLIASPRLSVDLDDFRTALAEAHDADERGLPSVALGHFERALGLWRGPALADVRYEEWARAVVDELTAGYVAAAVRAAELHLAAGRVVQARVRARAALAADEWCEPAHRILIAAALAAGDRAAASQALAACDAMLADLGVGPDPLTDTLRRRLAPSARPEPVRSLRPAA